MVKRAQTSKTETETKTEAKTKMSRLAETGILASRSKSRAHFWLKDGAQTFGLKTETRRDHQLGFETNLMSRLQHL